MKYLDDIMELADKEFEVYAKNGKFRSREEIDTAYKLVDIIKDIYCIWKYEGEGYSEEGSYGRRRDSMGRYTSDNGREEYLRQLRSMADSAPDDRTRNNISRMVREIERG